MNLNNEIQDSLCGFAPLREKIAVKLTDPIPEKLINFELDQTK